MNDHTNLRADVERYWDLTPEQQADPAEINAHMDALEALIIGAQPHEGGVS